MAKEQLTLEELTAKKVRRSNGWTRFWAILLALVLVGAGTFVVSNRAKTAREEADKALAEQQAAIEEANANAQAVVGGGTVGGGAASAEELNVAQEAADAINAATKAAVDGKAGYTWSRTSEFTKAVDVGGATSTLNSIIQAVDSNASIDSVVGGFIGIGSKTLDIPKGADAAAEIDYHGAYYALKATSLQAGDLQGLQVNGDTYTFTLPDANTPKRDGSSALNRLTEDIVVQDEVSAEIQNQVGSALSVTSLVGLYSNIKVSVTITEGKLTEMSYSYDAEVSELGLQAAIIPITGTGAMHTEATYSNFVY